MTHAAPCMHIAAGAELRITKWTEAAHMTERNWWRSHQSDHDERNSRCSTHGVLLPFTAWYGHDVSCSGVMKATGAVARTELSVAAAHIVCYFRWRSQRNSWLRHESDSKRSVNQWLGIRDSRFYIYQSETGHRCSRCSTLCVLLPFTVSVQSLQHT